MSSWRGRFLLLTLLSTASALYGCSSDSDDDDDDGGEGGEAGEGAVLGGTGGGSAATGGTASASGGSGNAASGGTNASGSGGAVPGSGGTGTSGGGNGSGNAGSGGSTSGTGGGVSGGGSGGAVAAIANIGAECEADVDCGTGLICITPDSTIFGSGGPAGGLCSRVCEVAEDCGTTAYCVPFEEDATTGYCIEACQTGSAGEPKCHERSNVACGLLGLIPTTTACTSREDCGSGQLCDAEAGTCGDIVPGCVPTCGGDFDCGSGQYCSFATGLCTDGSASGSDIGELCDPAAATDPCSGFCSATNEAGTEGICSALCTLSPSLAGCGWSGEGSADAACLFGTVLSPEGDAGVGDVGLCGALCDCNDDCNAENDRCLDQTGGDVLSLFGRNGYCRPLATDETESDSFACE
jgi:hypothetical protein